MYSITVQQAKLISLIISCISLMLVFPLNLFSFLFSILLMHSTIKLLSPKLEQSINDRRARLVVTIIITIIIIGCVTMLVLALIWSGSHIINNMDELRQHLKLGIDTFYNSVNSMFHITIPVKQDELFAMMSTNLKNNLNTFKHIGEKTLTILMHILLGLIVGALISLRKETPYNPNLLLKNEFQTRLYNFSESFINVVFAQLKISFLNTIFTTVYLIIVLPILDVHLPFTKTLIILTFIFGLLPIIGNIISNTLICFASITVSFSTAIISLIFLILIHKLEYFLNAKIIGGRIKSSAWELLIAMIVFKAIFGVSGLIAAPIYYAYFKQELKNSKLI